MSRQVPGCTLVAGAPVDAALVVIRRQSWTHDDVTELVRLCGEGLRDDAIAAALGRTPGSVRLAAYQLRRTRHLPYAPRRA